MGGPNNSGIILIGQLESMVIGEGLLGPQALYTGFLNLYDLQL